ncbi:NAD-binding Rossmann fold oxidoreductase family protein [Dactylonectria estremocensis]|uniref:NAD-binding Rossmann fold oxidoreductase family protein n=1 Tax=Dactylonectria estremocensis TaxID=1079267 RepID=A0A9P9EN43_9HYPO|nr:NAD-binding Rossmann fold oxidoreductase family protein [Dactylonectria estremocensis]
MPHEQQSTVQNGHPFQGGQTCPTKKLRVGVVGIGRMGQRHAMNVLHKVPRATLLCACSPAEADLVWAQEHLVPHGVTVVPTFDEMIEIPWLDAIIISSATHLHAEQTIAALDKGIHVLCEKPVCKTLDELDSLVKKTEASSRAKLMVGFVRRFDENYKEAREQIQQNAIGRPVVIRSQGCEPLDTSPFFKQYLKDSGGVFIDSIIHDIDLSLYLFGEGSRPKSVSASGVAAIHSELEEYGDTDNTVGICEYWDGKIAFFYNSRTTAHGYDNATEIFGTAGKLSINLIPRRNAIELCDKDGFIKTPAHPGWYDRYASAFVIEATEWVNAVLDDKPLPVPLRSSLTSLKIATAFQDSLRTGHKVFFDRVGVRQE